MSQNFGNLSIFNLTLLLWLFLVVGCDPCRQLAEKICSCRANEDEKRTCMNNLSLPPEHVYFKNAKSAEVCEQALKDCDCTQLNNAEDEKCGMDRPPSTTR